MDNIKFTVDEMLEDAFLSQMNTEVGDDEYKKWEIIIDFLKDYKHCESRRTIQTVEDTILWDTNLKSNDAN